MDPAEEAFAVHEPVREDDRLVRHMVLRTVVPELDGDLVVRHARPDHVEYVLGSSDDDGQAVCGDGSGGPLDLEHLHGVPRRAPPAIDDQSTLVRLQLDRVVGHRTEAGDTSDAFGRAERLVHLR